MKFLGSSHAPIGWRDGMGESKQTTIEFIMIVDLVTSQSVNTIVEKGLDEYPDGRRNQPT